jgi:protein ImuA
MEEPRNMPRGPEPGERHLLVARLREEIRRIERRPGRREGLVSCGIEAVDAVLPGGGFARGALAELVGGPASGKCAVALALLARLGDEDLFAWVDGRGELYPPAAAARGVDLGRLLVVRPLAAPPRTLGAPGPSAASGSDGWRSALWAAEAVLASGAFAAVVMDLPLPRAIPGADAAARRLQAAAERGGAVGLWLNGARGGLRLPGAVRLELSASDGRIAARREGAPAAAHGGETGIRRVVALHPPGALGGGRAA